MPDPDSDVVRCAIYTRKSASAGADQPFTSLDAQREVCSAYIRCNAHRGWVEVPDRFDDAGFSGGNLDRPALRRVLNDAAAGRVDVILLYKIDRLTRSLSDFVRLSDMLQQSGIAFVSVTQSFDTSDSMGRMILNILLTFAEFEREMLSDRIKDKLRAMKGQGLFVNGHPPLGYNKIGGRLIVNEQEASIVRSIFERFDQYPTAWALLQQLQREGVRHKTIITKAGKVTGGTLIHHGTFYGMLKNRLYLGEIRDGQAWCPGAHPAIVPEALFDHVQAVHAARTRKVEPWDPARNPLRGLLYDHHQRELRLETGGSGHRRYRYYASDTKHTARGRTHDKVRVRADAIEALTKSSLVDMLGNPEKVAKASTRSESPMQVDQASCDQAAALLESSTGLPLRRLYLALISRIYVTSTSMTLHLSTQALEQLLKHGRIIADEAKKGSTVTFALEVAADLITAHRDFRLPIQPNTVRSKPNRQLVNLLQRAFAARSLVMTNRQETISVLARRCGLGPSKFSRLLRLTYLAPDIQAAIYDGTQPDGLTPHSLIYSPLPLDWGQQRRILNFPTPPMP